MSRRIIVAMFNTEDDAAGAVHAMQGKGVKILDAFSPYPSEELIHAVGVKPSRLVWAAFAFGLLGVGLMTLFQFWASATDWAIDVGGKPWNSLPAFAPVIFEVMVLFTGLGVVFFLFAICGLFPGRKARMVAPQSTDDRFSIVMEHSNAAYKLDELKDVLAQYNMDALDEYIDDGGKQ